MAGFENNVLLAENVNFNPGNPPNNGQVTTDGQLLIGSTIAPNIKVGTLSSSDSSITWTVGSGTISGIVAGGTTSIKTINGLPPTAGNIDIVGTANQVQVANATSTVTLSTPTTFIAPGSTTSTTFMTVGTILNMPNANAALNQGTILWANGTRIHNFGTNNFFAGITSGNGTLTGTADVGIGTSALGSLTSGSDNVAIGVNSAAMLQGGTGNLAIGTSALTTATSANSNTAIGRSAIRLNATGANNTAVGFEALRNVLGASNTAIGYQAGNAYTGTEAGNISIGAGVSGTLGESNITRIGASTQTDAYISGTLRTDKGRVISVTTPGAYPYTALPADHMILVDTTSARTINLLAAPTAGRMYIIKDATGSAATNNITVSGNGSNIDGAASTTIASNYGSITVVYTGTIWAVI